MKNFTTPEGFPQNDAWSYYYIDSKDGDGLELRAQRNDDKTRHKVIFWRKNGWLYSKASVARLANLGIAAEKANDSQMRSKVNAKDVSEQQIAELLEVILPAAIAEGDAEIIPAYIPKVPGVVPYYVGQEGSDDLQLRLATEDETRRFAVIAWFRKKGLLCKAPPEALAAVGVEARPSSDSQMASTVDIADWDAPETPEILRKIIVASLEVE